MRAGMRGQARGAGGSGGWRPTAAAAAAHLSGGASSPISTSIAACTTRRSCPGVEGRTKGSRKLQIASWNLKTLVKQEELCWVVHRKAEEQHHSSQQP